MARSSLPQHRSSPRLSQQISQRFTCLLLETNFQHFAALNPIHPEVAKVSPGFAPGGQRPDFAPIKAAQRAQGALTGFVLWVLISDLQFALRLNGFAQVLQALALDAAKPGDAALRRLDSLAFGSGSDSSGQHRQNFAKCCFSA